MHVVVSGNGQSGVADHAVDANCGAPAVSTPVIASVNALSPTGTVYVDDVVEIATSAVSQCFASPTFSYAYTISLNGVASDAAFSPTANVAQPTFVPRTFGGTYAVSVAISDATAQPGSPVAPLVIPVSTCGSAPVTANYVATQHFDGIVQLQPGAADPTTALLDITQTPPSLTPISTLDVSGTPRTFDVPFYLDRRISLDVKVTLPAGCASAHFDGSQIVDPTFSLVPEDRFTHPVPTNVSDGQHLQFTFTARIGDTPDGSGGTNPGFHNLQLFFSSGSVNNPQTDIVQSATPIHVVGRCGLNAPLVNATLTPPSGLAAAPVAVTATADAQDTDNETLVFTTAATPADDPGTSTGCGLDQTFTYLWTLLTVPTTDSTAVIAPPDALVAQFTADKAGSYEIELVVGDGTSSGTNGDGKATNQFLYEATP